MKRVVLTSKRLLLLFTIFVCSAGIFFSGKVFGAADRSGAAVADLFIADGAIISNDVSAGGGKGVLFKAKNPDNSIALKDTLSGKFAMEFDYYADLPAFTVNFRNKNDEVGFFSVRVQNTGGGSSVYVESQGKKAGIYYKDGAPLYATREKNAAGKYTVSAGGDHTLSFDPERLEVKIGDLTVWSFADTSNDGCDIGVMFAPFAEYRVSVTLNTGSLNREWRGLILYALSGQALSGIGLSNTAGVNIFSNLTSNAVIGQSYIIPRPYGYDVKDGAVSSEAIKISVAYGSATVLPETPYTEGLSFLPYRTGGYTITYGAVDGDGKASRETRGIQCRETDEGGFTFDAVILSDTYGKGSSIYIPKAVYGGNMPINRGGVQADLSVFLNGAPVESGLAAAEQFIFAEAGEYEFVYSASAFNKSTALTYSVVENYPAISAVSVPKDNASGDSMAVPRPVLTHNGSDLEYKAVVYYPNGEAFVADGKIKPALPGTYTLEYRTQADNTLYRYSYAFNVYEKIYGVAGKGGADYGYPESFLTDREGLLVHLGDSGAEFKYSQAVDLNKSGSGLPFFSFYAVPRTAWATGDVGESSRTYFVKLTDKYDSENTVTVAVKQQPGDKCYIQAAATGAGQQYNGLDANGYLTAMFYNYTQNRYNFGTPVNADFRAGAGGVPIHLAYDTATNSLYAGAGAVCGQLVADLDNSDYFPVQWSGFTTGEVYLSVYAGDWIFYDIFGGYGDILIENIGGYDCASAAYFGYDLSEQYFKHGEEPVIRIDRGSQTGTVPEAKRNAPYTFFPAAATAADGSSLPVSTRVYYGYDSANYTEVPVTDNKFTPVWAGSYTVVYTAVDVFGKTGTRMYGVSVQEYAPISIDLDNSADTAFAGEAYAVRSVEVKGGSGSPAISVNVSGGGAGFAVSGGRFVPSLAGEYTVQYTAVDYLGEIAVGEYILTVTAGTPVFGAEPAIPKAFIKGMSYTLPDYFASDYAGGSGREVKASVAVTDTDGPQAGGAYLPGAALTHGSIATVVYTAESAGGTAEKTYAVPIVDPKKDDQSLDMSRWFIPGGGAVTEADENGVFVVGKAGDAEPVATLANPVSINGFFIKFKGDSARLNFTKIVYYLTDSLDPGISVKVTLYRTPQKQGGVYDYRINENSSLFVWGAWLSGSFLASNPNGIGAVFFEMYFDIYSNQFYNNSNPRVTVTDTMNGEPFNGFPSGKVYLSIGLSGVTGDAAVLVNQINNQILTPRANDRVAPTVSALGQYGGIVELGQTVTLPAFIAADMLTPVNDITVSILTPSKQKIPAAADGQFTFLAEEYGIYEVTAEALDGYGNRGRLVITYYSVDTVAPTLTVNGTVPATGNTGEKIILPGASATDNTPQALTVYLFVTDPGEVMGEVLNHELIPARKGIYTVYYVVYDAAGNLAAASYKITVS
jgi:hypothetical protein